MNCVDQIEGLLRIELSAVETYERAVGERAWDLLGADQAEHLVSILADHLEAASQLQATVQQTTSTPVDGVEKREAWFTLGIEANRLFGDAKLFSDQAAIQAFKKGEESSLKAYQNILQDPAMPTPVKAFVDSLVTKQRAHIRALGRLLENFRNHPSTIPSEIERPKQGWVRPDEVRPANPADAYPTELGLGRVRVGGATVEPRARKPVSWAVRMVRPWWNILE